MELFYPLTVSRFPAPNLVQPTNQNPRVMALFEEGYEMLCKGLWTAWMKCLF